MWSTHRRRWLAAGAVVAGTMTMALWLTLGDVASTEQPAASAASLPRTFAPAARLRIAAPSIAASADQLLAGEDDVWKTAPSTSIIMNRTPRIYQTEPIHDRPPLTLRAQGARAQSRLWIRLRWSDATKSATEAPPARTGEGGEPKLLYKRPTGETTAFADAAAVMVPDAWIGPAFPSLLMGDKTSPATLYYWSAPRGGREMTASGRATPQPTGATFPVRARHADGTWTVTMSLPDHPDGYPIAFAVWDGAFAERDGLKSFSVWHVLTQQEDGK